MELARTELRFGEHLRRERRRTDAQPHLPTGSRSAARSWQWSPYSASRVSCSTLTCERPEQEQRRMAARTDPPRAPSLPPCS
jgi:hypothetical protein